MKEKNKLAALFFTMMKIGLFTFGGGYAMISLLHNEFAARKQWIDDKEFLDMAAIAESTPGPIAINAATYIGYNTAGFPGALLSTVAVCIPSFLIIYLISLFFDAFLSIEVFSAAFRGIRACVVWLVLAAGINLFRKMKKDVFSLICAAVCAAAVLAVNFFSVDFSVIFCILASGAAGLILYYIRSFIRKAGIGK